MRGGFRGHRGGGRPQSMGPSFMVRSPPFDIHNCGESFERVNVYDEAPLTQCVRTRSEQLVPTEEERNTVTTLLNRVKVIVDNIVNNTEVNNEFKIEEVREVGSWKKDVALLGHLTADIAIVMGILPSYELVTKFGTLVIEELQALHEVATFATREYGIHISGEHAELKLLVTTVPGNVGLLQPETHLPERSMMYNYHSIRHAAWFESVSDNSPIRVLLRVMKDVRSRFPGLHPLSVWAMEFLCQFCLLHTPNRVPLPLGPAFRRFFEALAAGLFLPGSPGLVDPTEPGFRIAFDMTLEEMDSVCSTAQMLVRLLNYDGYDIVLGNTVLPEISGDITRNRITVNGVTLANLEPAFIEGCLKPKFCDEDEALAEKLAAATA